jgi:hypothetical protein
MVEFGLMFLRDDASMSKDGFCWWTRWKRCTFCRFEFDFGDNDNDDGNGDDVQNVEQLGSHSEW